MTFLPPKPEREPLDSITLRLPVSLVKYIQETAKQRGLNHTAIATDALRTTRDLSALLDASMPKIRLWGLRHGIDPYHQMAEVLAKLIEAALASDEEPKQNM